MAHTILAVDQRGWCFHNIARQIAPRLSDLCSFDIQVAREVKKGPCDVLVCFWWGDTLRLKANTHPQATVTCLYDHLSWRTPDQRALSPEFKLCLKQTDILTVCNKRMESEVRSLADCPLPPIFVTPDGVDTHLFDLRPLPKEFKVGWTGNAQRLAPTGTEDHKGIGLIREACKLANVKLSYLDASTGDPWDQWEMPEFYHGISVYICASVSEGTPNPILEAMSCGRPVVSTNVGIVPHVVTPGKSGLIVKRDSREMAVAIDTLRRTFAQGGLSRMGRAARDSVMAWSWDSTIEPWRELIHTALSSNAGYVAGCQIGPSRQGNTQSDVHAVAKDIPRRIREPGDKPRCLCMSDVRGWAFDVGMRDLEAYLSPYWEFEHYYIVDWPHIAFPDQSRYDAIFCPYTRWRTKDVMVYDRTIGALRSSCWFGDIPNRKPGQEQFDLVNRFRAFQVVTRESFRDLEKDCPNVRYIPNPVNIQKFLNPTEVDDRLVAVWAGNAHRVTAGKQHVKGFNSHIVPACYEAGVPLEFAEFRDKRLPHAEMPKLYRKGNVFVHASMFEGCSKALLEAMASGLCVISTDVGQIKEMQQNQIKHYGETGIILVDRNVGEYVSVLNDLKRDPRKVIELGRLNRAEIIDRWSWEHWKDEYNNLLKMGL